MITLTDTQRILLSAASQRKSGSIRPTHGSLKPGGGAAKSIVSLIRHGLVEERETIDQAEVNRTDGDVRYGAYITAAGLAAIGIDEEGEALPGHTPVSLPEIVDVEKAPTKIAQVLELLAQPDGVLLPDLMEATGWLPHTIRAAITGLRKKRHSIQRIKCDGVTGYRLLSAAQ
ncbi:hypothetical protein GGQ80_000619 [Sphingomonas jinjuensis]|uniref:DUF3489 domain-containing protein n=1 Tax=Sphingomonas jinjuensis TaxID=535907 RepID=A0A840F0D6_9SPHN|nr:DUF3489 domain-containing protein [Sphingomonas jinjuensis]MBB4152743.1 hypothetical protein [Sphingomonas jinjuensis]